MTVFCSTTRQSSPIQKITADTHQRNINRFVGFVILHLKELRKHSIIPHEFDEIIYFSTNLISIYLQVNLNNSCGGPYIILMLRSIYNFIKFLHSKFNYEKEYNETILFLKSILKAFNYNYVYYQTKQQFQDLNSWIDYKEFQTLSLNYYDNTCKWIEHLTQSLPICVKSSNLFANLCTKQQIKLENNWKNGFVRRKSTMFQESLFCLLLSSIPTPRSSNLKNLCIYFRKKKDDDLKVQLSCYKFGIKSILEVKNLTDNQISYFNNTLCGYFNDETRINDEDSIENCANCANLSIRYLTYKTQKFKSNEDVEVEINSGYFKTAFFNYLQIGSHYQFLIQNPIKKSKKERSKYLIDVTNSFYFPIWINSDGNIFISSQVKADYDKSSDTKFTVWMNRILEKVTNKHLTINILRKTCVTMSREERWDDESKNSLAISMMHTVQTADTVYCKTKTIEKTNLAVKRLSIK